MYFVSQEGQAEGPASLGVLFHGMLYQLQVTTSYCLLRLVKV